LAQAPDSIAGCTYRDVTSSVAPYVYYDSLDFHSDGTYVTRALIYASTVWGNGTYSTPTNGTYTYARQGSNEASITLNPTTGVGNAGYTLTLSFTDNLTGTVTRSFGGISGSFYLSQSTPNASTSLTNVSTLVSVRQGNPVTVGFVVGGSQVHEFLVRAVGPSLALFGVDAPAMNPVYSLVGRTSSFTSMPGEYTPPGTSIQGVGWSTTPDQLATVAAETVRAGAFPLSVGSNDKSDVFLLFPGSYTVVVNASSAASAGTVLIEVYEVP
jgi:hypothetical protein